MIHGRPTHLDRIGQLLHTQQHLGPALDTQDNLLGCKSSTTSTAQPKRPTPPTVADGVTCVRLTCQAADLHSNDTVPPRQACSCSQHLLRLGLQQKQHFGRG